MIVTFCGHSEFSATEEYERRLLAFLEEKVGDKPVDMYLGGYGGFDSFAYGCCEKFKKTHPDVSLILVTPYLTAEYQHNHLQYEKIKYDFILYPEIEDKPIRYAITYRNQYMVEKADYVVAYVSHGWGGAYTTYRYAQRKGKNIYNLADFQEQVGLTV
ncbi:MAG: hypothetical protein IJC99_04630 [Clostridia bacterium]|nr:hypothetical protein [Clostridia bacterium]